MIRIEPVAWKLMLDHARQAYPRECCGILLGIETKQGERVVTSAYPTRNAYEGDQGDRFLIDPRDQVTANLKCRTEDIDIIGFFHSHPDCEAYFSATDLKNSWPWYSNVVLSIRHGEIAGAAAFRANEDQTQSDPEDLLYPAPSPALQSPTVQSSLGGAQPGMESST